ncbi:hypothetical protein AGDE_01771 [Angomonas deanei]|uniref:Uncharacterized protein n=1 Tax=Angomonas deanei TaxID=59799 RepID=A0A7G2CDE1_9TRYP|nr:hypothetical protein AGDE_01771 [Angomonas deanei]CAD2217846.1 hypothetical protein, conserved [Angomonas deanei]|eukprot:EPY42152.1 hypothetical protein AGDE_01771 [Angomonas deanei]
MHRSACRFVARSALLYSNDQYKQFSDLLSKTQSHPKKGSADDLFNGNFRSDAFIDPSVISNMQQTLQANLTPEMRDSMASILQSALQNGDGMPGGQMGMMAFGVGENEKGKKVARGAKLSYDLKTGKVNKDFVEQQLEEDDVSLPKDTVEDYTTDGAIEVEFEEDTKKIKDAEPIVETEIEIETPSKGSERYF